MLKIIKIETHIENEAKGNNMEGNELRIDFVLETKTDVSILYEMLYALCNGTFYVHFMSLDDVKDVCRLDFGYNNVVNILTIESYKSNLKINWGLKKVELNNYLFYEYK